MTTDQDQIRLVTLINVRWVALSCYALVFLLSYYIGAESVPWVLTCSTIAFGFLWNIFLSSKYSKLLRVRSLIGITIYLDILLLATLLYGSGGYANPFSMMFIVHVTLAAVFLNLRWTWGAFLLSAVCFMALFFFYVPLPQLTMSGMHMSDSGFSLHLHGMLVVFLIIGAIVAFFLTRLRSQIETQQVELDRLRYKKLLEEKLLGLTTVTAGAAHELATPLGTIALVSEDMKAELQADPRWSNDVNLLSQEIGRCKNILDKMRGQSGELKGEIPSSTSWKAVFTEVKEALPPGVPVRFEGAVESGAQFLILKEALVSSLLSIIKNGVQASSGASPVVVTVSKEQRIAKVTVQDHGCGMDSETVSRAGEPFFTTKEPGKGMGLGLFLARLFTEQIGGSLEISSSPQKGTTVFLTIPMDSAV